MAQELVAGSKNAASVHCCRCNCKVLSKDSATLVHREYELPHMTLKARGEGESDRETHIKFWLLTNMYDFDNVGFSNTLEGSTLKYLTCADCEIGPIGWHDTADAQAFYLCAEGRVKYV
eukprot:comp9878_c0_seq1/m.4817 comp9878_c0_seq1/g.4817  ORF comp9878_c0_seq1/g.4817 comp9878_c0_seq1/m.4817 type:complete len:119 (-) comp9878_c0_seq1:61-417(-)